MAKKIVLTEEQLRDIICGVISDDSNLMEYARVGFVGDKGGLEVYVMTDDPGYIPHFHVRDYKTRGKEFDTCIEIQRNKYFIHGHHSGKLNAAQRKSLAEFMEGPCQNGKYGSNYELTVDMWNLNNSNANVEFDGETIPDYRTIED